MTRYPKISGFLERTRKHVNRRFRKGPKETFMLFFQTFQKILTLNNSMLALIAEMGDKLSGDYIFDSRYIITTCDAASDLVYQLISELNALSSGKYHDLFTAFHRIRREIGEELAGRPVIPKGEFMISYDQLNRDFTDLVGAKNANLGEIRQSLGLTIPEGFAITTRAFSSFMNHNKLWEKIDSVLNAFSEDEISVDQASEEIQEMIRKASIPSDIKKALKKSVEQLSLKTGLEKPYMAVRSSAWGEDTQASFAGQYETFLNQPVEEIAGSYQRVVESAYSASVMEYRRQKGYSEKEVVMAVGCQAMIYARVSGVIYTLDPMAPEKDVMLVSALWGLGSAVVEGRASADQYLVRRKPPFKAESSAIECKKEKTVLAAVGGTKSVPVSEKDRERPCLTPEQLAEIAEIAMMIEAHFMAPQDIEFAIDQENKLVILQVRPLNIKISRKKMARNLSEVLKNFPVIAEGKGIIAQRGVGVGKVHIVAQDSDLETLPHGAILVAKDTSPRFARVIRKISGIITDVGSPTGHMATIAREFRVPTIVNMGNATDILKPGQEITLDAEENKIYEGMIKELKTYSLAEDTLEEAYEYRLLRRVLKKISLLNLLDPSSKNFKPSSCETFHDITRFIHEKAVEELINREYRYHQDTKRTMGKLKLGVPLDLVLIDFADGLERDAKDTILPEQIFSIPMSAFVCGLMTPGAWNTEPMSVDLGSFMSSMTRTFSTGLATPEFVGRNMAVISKPYAHISLRLGYHFNMIDAYVCDDLNSNYVYFQFMGGVTDEARRSRRARLLADLLYAHDFRVELKGDLVVARIKKLSVEEMKIKLHLLGVLVAFSRQLDVQMSNDEQIKRYMDIFERLLETDPEPEKYHFR